VDDGTGVVDMELWNGDAAYTGVDPTKIQLGSLLVAKCLLHSYDGRKTIRAVATGDDVICDCISVVLGMQISSVPLTRLHSHINYSYYVNLCRSTRRQ
jgi:hypothetical protein